MLGERRSTTKTQQSIALSILCLITVYTLSLVCCNLFILSIIFKLRSTPETKPALVSLPSRDIFLCKGLFTQSNRYEVTFVSYNTFRCRTTRQAQIGAILSFVARHNRSDFVNRPQLDRNRGPAR
jgi:hypothetical protein